MRARSSARWKNARAGPGEGEKREKRKGDRDGAREGEVDFGGRSTPNYLKYTGDATFSDIYN